MRHDKLVLRRRPTLEHLTGLSEQPHDNLTPLPRHHAEQRRTSRTRQRIQLSHRCIMPGLPHPHDSCGSSLRLVPQRRYIHAL